MTSKQLTLDAQLAEAARVSTEYAKTIPVLYRPGFLRAASGKASPRQAIKAKCYECCGYEDIRERIPNCTVYTCPAWRYRPISKGGK